MSYTRTLASGTTVTVEDDGSVRKAHVWEKAGETYYDVTPDPTLEIDVDPTDPDVQAWLPTAEESPELGKCWECNGSGIWRGGGAVINGVYKGPQGTCYRCNGIGTKNVSDVKRNRYYDNHVRRISL